MQAAEVDRAIAAAMTIASSSGLAARDAIVLHDSNKLTLRLLPCDVVARVAPGATTSPRSRSSSHNGSPNSGARWRPSTLGWSHASTNATGSR